MASLLESLSSSLTPETLGSLGTSLGIDPNLLSQGLGVVGPLLQSGTAQAAAAPGGADMLSGLLSNLPDSMASDPVGSITSMLGSGGGLGGLLGGLGGMLGGGGGGAAASGTPDIASALLGNGAAGNPLSGLLNSGFGSGLGAVSKSLSGSLGFDVAPLLAAGMPMLLGMLKKTAGEKNLDSAGIANMLKSENDAFLASGSPQAKMVQGALDVGKQARDLRGSFSAEEWATVRSAPLAVAGLVTGASGTGGTAAELGAAASSVAALAGAANPASVLSMSFEQPFSKADLDAVAAGSTKEASVASIAAAIRLVAAKSPDEAAGFKQMLLQVGKDVAGATKQGGFLGFGGTKITDAEVAALRDLEDAIKSS